MNCQAQYSWNPEWHCQRRGLPRLCLTHLLDRCRWEWDLGNFRVSLDLSNFNRFTLHVDQDRYPGARPRWWSLDFGNDGCDPAVSLSWHHPSIQGDHHE